MVRSNEVGSNPSASNSEEIGQPKMVRLCGQSSNQLFEVLAQWNEALEREPLPPGLNDEMSFPKPELG